MHAMNSWLINYHAAKACGMIDLWPDPASFGVVQDQWAMKMRLVAGSPAHETRVRMGLKDNKPGDGYLWDIWNCLEDLERAEVALGIIQLTVMERLAKVAKEVERKS
jgi:hypothetical protein